jgi:hypothetical protein
MVIKMDTIQSMDIEEVYHIFEMYLYLNLRIIIQILYVKSISMFT